MQTRLTRFFAENTKDLHIITARSEAKIEKTIHGQTRWVIMMIAVGIGILATVLKFI